MQSADGSAKRVEGRRIASLIQEEAQRVLNRNFGRNHIGKISTADVSGVCRHSAMLAVRTCSGVKEPPRAPRGTWADRGWLGRRLVDGACLVVSFS